MDSKYIASQAESTQIPVATLPNPCSYCALCMQFQSSFLKTIKIQKLVG